MTECHVGSVVSRSLRSGKPILDRDSGHLVSSASVASN